jgi:ABC-type dipeptide/oligopeptide/nickel transport system ATPase component
MPASEFARCSTKWACRRTPSAACPVNSAAANASASRSPELTTQARVLDLFLQIQRDTGVSYLFVSHDLDVVRHISHRVAVMYHGEIVEQGPAEQVTVTPQHPYTQRLLLASPVPDPDRQEARRTNRHRLIEAQKTAAAEDVAA